MERLSCLPDTLYNVILSYNCLQDQLSFTLSSRAYSHLLKYFRKILIGSPLSRIIDSSNRERILNSLANPYHQLNVILDSYYISRQLTGPIKCSQLSSAITIFTESVPDQFQEIRRLVLKQPRGFNDDPDFSDQLHQIIHRMADPNMKLQELSLSITQATDIPVIPHLTVLELSHFSRLEVEGLHLSDYSNLHCLKLEHCPQITDVKCLANIPELHLIACQNVRDISSLQHNRKIIIERCEGIVDYSKSFQYTKFVRIQSLDLKPSDLNFSHLLQIKEIQIKGIAVIPPQPISGPIFLCSSLRSLFIHLFKHPFELPENNLQNLVISACPALISLSNMGDICCLKLEDLSITSLSPLGRRNRFVEIARCAGVSDFSPLKSCERVSIINCSGFVDARQLERVKELKVELPDSQNPPILEGITHLEIDNLHSTLEFPLQLPSSLKTLVFKKVSSEYLAFFPAFLLDFPQITKVIVSLEGYNSKSYFIMRSKKNHHIRSQFVFEIFSNPSRLVLVKRE